jgi:hypothetical protein
MAFRLSEKYFGVRFGDLTCHSSSASRNSHRLLAQIGDCYFSIVVFWPELVIYPSLERPWYWGLARRLER